MTPSMTRPPEAPRSTAATAVEEVTSASAERMSKQALVGGPDHCLDRRADA
jgi:hypothetical protein